MDKSPDSKPATDPVDPADDWPDENTMIRRGDDDPYLAEMARLCRTGRVDESCSSGAAGLAWDGHERRDNAVDCFDPYVVELARSKRSEF